MYYYNSRSALLLFRCCAQWWGCSVAGAKTGERDEEEGRPVFTLHYDAFEAFEEADHEVCFVDR